MKRGIKKKRNEKLILYFVLPFLFGLFVSQSAIWIILRSEEMDKQKDEIAILSKKLEEREKITKALAEKLKNEEELNEAFNKLLQDIGKGK